MLRAAAIVTGPAKPAAKPAKAKAGKAKKAKSNKAEILAASEAATKAANDRAKTLGRKKKTKGGQFLASQKVGADEVEQVRLERP